MDFDESIFKKFYPDKIKSKNTSLLGIPSEIKKIGDIEFLLSTTILKDNLQFPNYDMFKNEYINCLELIYGIREKKSEKFHKKGIDNLLKAKCLDCFKDEIEKLLTALNSNDIKNLSHIIKNRFSSSNKLFFLLLSLFKKQELLFIDIETKNLSSETGIITAGIGFFENENFIIKQFTILNDAAEYEILNEFLKYLENKKLFVTFNGKTFDIPFLENRFGYYAIDCNDFSDFINFDLLFFSRSAFKNLSPSFALKDVEKNILKKFRKNDIGSEEVEIYYSKYLKTGNLSYLNPIIYHNKEDIIGMFLILKKLCEIWTK